MVLCRSIYNYIRIINCGFMVTEKEWNELKRKSRLLKKTAEILRVEEKDVPRVTKRFLDEVIEMEKQLKEKKSNSS